MNKPIVGQSMSLDTISAKTSFQTTQSQYRRNILSCGIHRKLGTQHRQNYDRYGGR